MTPWARCRTRAEPPRLEEAGYQLCTGVLFGSGQILRYPPSLFSVYVISFGVWCLKGVARGVCGGPTELAFPLPLGFSS